MDRLEAEQRETAQQVHEHSSRNMHDQDAGACDDSVLSERV